jgi:hypothetical protein
MNDQQALRDLVTLVVNTSENWIHRADDLMDGAALLLRASNMGLNDVPDEGATDAQLDAASRSLGRRLQSLMLYAFAIECLCKAHHVRNGNSMADQGQVKSLPGVNQAHDLLSVAEATGVKDLLTKAEQSVVDKLTLMTEIGRYPTARKADRYYHAAPSGPAPWQTMRSVWTSQDQAHLKTAIEALYGALREPLPEGLDVLVER